MQLSRLLRSPLCLALGACLLHGAQAETAEPQTLIRYGEHQVTTLDMQADALARIPEEHRAEVLGQPNNVENIAINLYFARVFAQEFEKDEAAKSPQIQLALRQAREKVLATAWREQLLARSQVSDEAAEALARTRYKASPERFATTEQVHVSHILIAGDGDESRDKAGDILEKLRAGADFAELAKEVSEDPGSGPKGGDLGFFARGKMVPEFDQAAFALKTGALSDLVKTQFGYHILLLHARRPAGTRPFEEVRDELVDEVKAKVLKDALTVETDKLRAVAEIDREAIKAYSDSWREKPAAAAQP